MMLLYKDPNGDGVFLCNELEVRQVTVLDGASLSSENDVDGLKKKIKHLESMVKEYQVQKKEYKI